MLNVFPKDASIRSGRKVVTHTCIVNRLAPHLLWTGPDSNLGASGKSCLSQDEIRSRVSVLNIPVETSSKRVSSRFDGRQRSILRMNRNLLHHACHAWSIASCLRRHARKAWQAVCATNVVCDAPPSITRSIKITESVTLLSRHTGVRGAKGCAPRSRMSTTR